MCDNVFNALGKGGTEQRLIFTDGASDSGPIGAEVAMGVGSVDRYYKGPHCPCRPVGG